MGSVLYTNRPEAAAEWDGVSQYLSPEVMDQFAASQDKINSDYAPTPIEKVPYEYGGFTFPGGKPPDRPPEQELPKLYKATVNPSDNSPTIPGPPPGEPGFEDTTRGKFIEHAIKTIGFDPLSLNPQQQAWQEVTAKYGGSGDTLPGPAYTIYEGRAKELTEKKQNGLMQLEFMVKMFDKDMGWENVSKGGALVQPGTGKMIQNPEIREYKTPDDTQLTIGALTQKLGRTPTSQEVLDAKEASAIKIAGAKASSTEKGRQEAQAGVLSPEAIQVEGIKFATTGKMPAMGMGGGLTVRASIMNAGAKYLIENGVDPKTVPAMQAEYNATNQAYASVKKGAEQIKGFEQGLIKNADYALELSQKIFRTGVIPANEVINYLKTKTGDPGIVKFGAALYAAAMEYEKVRTAGTGVTSAELSIGAQKKAEEIMNKAMTHEQLSGIVDAMKVDTSNITDGRQATLTNMSNEMGTLAQVFGRRGETPPLNKKSPEFDRLKRQNPTKTDAEIRSYMLYKGIR